MINLKENILSVLKNYFDIDNDLAFEATQSSDGKSGALVYFVNVREAIPKNLIAHYIIKVSKINDSWPKTKGTIDNTSLKAYKNAGTFVK